MRSNLFNLVKLELIDFTSSLFKTSKGNKKKKSMNSLIVYFLYYLLMTGLGIYLSFIYKIVPTESGEMLDNDTYTRVARLLVTFVAVMMVFTQSLTYVKRIFIKKDFDFLESLPISKFTISASNVISTYLAMFVISLPLVISGNVTIAILTRNYSLLGYMLIDAILLPVYPLAISTLLATLTGYISSFSKKFSDVIDIISYVILIGTISLSFFMGQGSLAVDTIEKYKYVLGPVYYILIGASDPIKYIIAVALSIACELITVLLVTIFYKKLHTITYRSKKSNYVMTTSSSNSISKALYKNELRRMVKTKGFLFQFLTGYILGLLISVFVFVSFMQSDVLQNDFIKQLAYIMVIVPLYFFSLVIPSQALINIEGDNIDNVKTYPIDGKTFIKAKIYASLTLTLPFVITEEILLIAFVGRTVPSIIAFAFIPVLSNIFNTILLLMFNLKRPRFDWKDIKQLSNGSNVLIGMLFDFLSIIIIGGITGVFGGLALTLNLGVLHYLAVIIPVIIYIFFIYLVYNLLMNNVDEKINKI